MVDYQYNDGFIEVKSIQEDPFILKFLETVRNYAAKYPEETAVLYGDGEEAAAARKKWLTRLTFAMVKRVFGDALNEKIEASGAKMPPEEIEKYINMRPRNDEETELKASAVYSLFEVPDLYTLYIETQRIYRTVGEDVSHIPERLALISDNNLKNALSYYTGSTKQTAYLLLLKDINKLSIDPASGLLIDENGNDVSADVVNQHIDDQISGIDPGFLSVVFSIVKNDMESNKGIKEAYDVDLTELHKVLHPGTNRSKPKPKPGDDKKRNDPLLDAFKKFDQLFGVIITKDNGVAYRKYYKVLNFMGYDEKTDIVHFSAPYIVNVLQEVYNKKIIQTKNKQPKLKANGLAETKPYVSEIVKMTLRGEKNKRAVRIVEIIVVLIEQCGNFTPNITAETIVSYMPDFRAALNATRTASDKNKKLDRAFRRALEILNEDPDPVTGETRLGLKEKYINIQLPAVTPENIPTVTTLRSTLYEFKHEGTVKKPKQTDQPEEKQPKKRTRKRKK